LALEAGKIHLSLPAAFRWSDSTWTTTLPDLSVLQFRPQLALEPGEIQMPLLLPLALEVGKSHLRSRLPIGESRGLSDRNLPPK
jgi:hypothetical protein